MENLYRSRNNIYTILWQLIHTVSFCGRSSEEIIMKEHENILEKLEIIAKLISCKTCQEHYLNELEKAKKLNLQEKYCLFYWSVDLHNQINQKLGKPILSHQEAFQIWNRKRC
jgi:hypothetical protein